jgi:hypothetical protein
MLSGAVNGKGRIVSGSESAIALMKDQVDNLRKKSITLLPFIPV